jgi:putative tail protein/Hint domain-containing protein
MGIFGDSQKPQREFNVRVNESCYGYPVITVMGTAQVEQQIYWIDGFQRKTISSKGGGKGGGKGGEYIYSADVVVGLCNGPILGVGDVWAGQSWLGSPTLAESYTISNPYQYTPTQAATLNNDLGVSVANTYSESYNDLGAPSATVLSGTDYAAMKAVSYGTTLTTGLYSINPTGNVYNFSSADNGRTVQVSYSYNVTDINRQENDIVPSGKQISVSGTGTGSKVVADLGVIYTLTGVAFTKVSGTPSVTGTYSVSGNNPAVYKFATGDINAEVTISFTVNDPSVVQKGETQTLNYTLNSGTQGQSPYSFLTSSYPDAAFGYTSIATLLYQPMDLGMGAEIQQNRFEVITPDVMGGGIQDCNPVQCIGQVLTNSVWGLGVGTVPFPTACIDNGPNGTWGGVSGTPWGGRLVGSTAWNWFAAQSFFISPSIDGQDTAASTMSKWLEAGMCAAFFSEGLLKLVPYGDTSAAANGYTWTAPSQYVVALDDTCFLAPKEGEDPVKQSRVSAHDAWNVVQIQFDYRLNQYAPQIVQESDQALINRWGERREDPQNWDFIHTIPAATFAANLRIKHNAYARNVYEFSVPYTYGYMEPMDIIEITTSSIWANQQNNLNLGLSGKPVRITKIVDDPEKGLAITCEDYPWGAHQPTIYNKQLSEAETPANAYADPGNTEVVMFEASNELTGYQGDEIWIGALGTSEQWGSCVIWVSQSAGGDYQPVGSITLPARLGELASTFGDTYALEPGSPPPLDVDTTDTMVVNLAENCGTWEAGSTTDADYGNTAVFCDGEIISYSALTYTGQDQITCGTYIVRGQMGTTITSHSAGGLVLRLDNAIFKYTYPAQFRGETLYFKFQSLNYFGLMAQDLSTLTPTAFTLPGVSKGTVDAESGIILGNALPYSSPMNQQGSLPAGSNPALSYTSNSSSITWTWTAFTVYNLDGSSYSVAANSGGTTFSSLSSSSTYYFGFYAVVSTGICSVILSDVNGGKSDESAQQLVTVIQGDGHSAVAWNVPASTTASGSGGGGGHGGTGGGCFTGNTLVKTSRGNVRIGEIEPGDLVLTAKGTYAPVQQLIVHEAEPRMMHHIYSTDEFVTRTHKILHKGKWVNAGEIFPEEVPCDEEVYTLGMFSKEPREKMLEPDTERSFVLTNGLICHNDVPVK